MPIAGLKTRFLVELIELYGEAVGSTEQQRLLGRLSERHRGWFLPCSHTLQRPEVLFLDDVEAILWALEDSDGRGAASRFEFAATEVAVRAILRRPLAQSNLTFRECLLRFITYVEDYWPIRPPTIALEETPLGLRLSVMQLGYSRCTRLLVFQLQGALRAACRLGIGLTIDELHATLDFFGDRARIDVHLRGDEQSMQTDHLQPPSRRPSIRSVRPSRPSLSEEVESILGHRAIPPSGSAHPIPSRPPNSALGMAQLRRPSRPVFPAAPTPSTRPNPQSPSSPFASPRLPTFEAPQGTAESQPAGPPTSRSRIPSEQPTQPRSVPPPSRRGGQR